MALVIGLTGGIASGKTTVANLFRDHFDIDIVDADIIARQVVEKGSEGLKAIEQHFGASILTEQGELNRSELRQRIFANDEEKVWVNQLLHPMIRHQMEQELKRVTSPYALLVVPLLAENNLQHMADRVLVVDVDEDTQIKRTVERDRVSPQQVKAILASQASREQRLAIADDVIVNNTQNQRLLPQITELHKKYLAISGTNL